MRVWVVGRGEVVGEGVGGGGRGEMKNNSKQIEIKREKTRCRNVPRGARRHYKITDRRLTNRRKTKR